MSDDPKHPRSEFFAGLSHRVRQPLNGVLEELNALLDTNLNPSQRSLIDLVQRRAHELLALLNDVLDLARLQAGNFVLADEPLDLLDVLDSVAANLTDFFGQKRNAPFTLLPHPDTPALVSGDAGRLKQALLNMALATPPPTGSSEVLLETAVEGESQYETRLAFSLHLQVEPADAALAVKMIEALAGSSHGEKEQFDDEGALRLAVAAEIAAAMGGGLEAETDGGDGLTLVFRATLGRVESLSHRDAGDPAGLEGLRVLLVSDSDEAAAPLATWLAEWNCDVRHVPLMDDAPALLRQAAGEDEAMQFALIVNHSHGQDAEDLGRTIKSDPDLRNTAVGLVTSVGRRGDAARLREIGFSFYLTQPVTQRQFRDAMGIVIEHIDLPPKQRAAAIITRHSLRERQVRGLRVAVLDDNATSRMITLLLLERMGCEAKALAAEEIPAQRFDLVLATEPHVEQLLARSGDTAAVPVIAVVGEIAGQQREELLAQGVRDVIGKPLTVAALRDAVGRIVAWREQNGAEEVASPSLVDAETLLRNFDDDREMLREVIAFFVQDFAEKLDALQAAVAAAKVEDAKEIAEDMRDAAGGLELRRLVDLMAEITRAASGERASQIPPLIEEAARLFARIKTALEEI
ncbi:MAG: histidine kinase dimerization/phospho-acceptor domain-containing protein [Candidatus Lernaella stagnicola]|nr:histidine kinase dimerization/phospho-acceptor domain-containing protein [Candidatus Lernaella stagnicola]